jgi:hypothetical protein
MRTIYRHRPTPSPHLPSVFTFKIQDTGYGVCQLSRTHGGSLTCKPITLRENYTDTDYGLRTEAQHARKRKHAK